MKKYEVAFIIQPNLEESKIQELSNKLKEIYTNSGSKIIDEEVVGMREMAYEIEKHKTGYYVFFTTESESKINDEFERICRLNEDVIRWLVIDIDDVEDYTLDVLRK